MVVQTAKGVQEVLAWLLWKVLPAAVPLLIRPAEQTQRESEGQRIYTQVRWVGCRWGGSSDLQVDGVGVQVHADHVGRGLIQIEVAGVHANNEGAGGVEYPRQGQRA